MYNIFKEKNKMKLITFDKKCKCGPEFVCVRILENCDNLKVGNIYLPTTAKANDRLAHCIIEDVGYKAAEEYGLAKGDYVLIDRLSTFAHTFPVALLRYNSVIVKTNKDKSDFWPLRNMIFVEPEVKPAISKVDNIYIPSSYDQKLRIGKILKINIDKELNTPFKVNDRVLLAQGADHVELGTTELYIYKHDMLVCVIEDDKIKEK